MSTNAASSTALERARLAYEQMKRREYNAAMKRRSRARDAQHRTGGDLWRHAWR